MPNIKSAKKMIENQDPRVWDVVEEKIKELTEENEELKEKIEEMRMRR